MITVKAEKFRNVRDDLLSEHYYVSYTKNEGLERSELCALQAGSDFSDAKKRRYSPDNGRTWGEWKDVYEESGYESYGEHERNFPKEVGGTWNPVHKHYVGCGLARIFKDGHKKALHDIWTTDGPSPLSDHTYVGVRTEDGNVMHQLVAYEDGADFDPADPLNEAHFYTNNSFPGSGFTVTKEGDILFPMGVPIDKCCKLAGVDVGDICRSMPARLRNLIVVRGVWNGEKYDFHFSKPILISDLQSSRGVDEPALCVLDSGRILVVFRGSNYQSAAWHTRIEPGTPGFKWYTWSDDGGKTFAPAMPWHFDDGEVIYSSATISKFIRDFRNGRLYWIGNITDHHVNANFPRYPLNIVEVDQTYGTAIKASHTVIDTRREGESEKVQLSNFSMLQNRETGNIELYLTKLGMTEGVNVHKSEVWRYEIILPE